MIRTPNYLVLATSLLGSAVALAQPEPTPTEGAPPEGTPPTEGTPPATDPNAATTTPPGDPPPSTSPPPATEKQQGKGDFDAGGKIRLPSGPDEKGDYGTFNWVGLDLYGRYFITDQLSITGLLPLAPIKPDLGDAAPDEIQPSIFGGFTVRPEFSLGKMLGVGVTLGMLKEGAILYSEKDFPYYRGDLKLAAAVGPYVKIKQFGLDFALQPSLVYQAGNDEMEGGTGTILAAQVPLAASLSLSDLIKVAVEAGVYTGDGFALGAADGGRISLGAAVDLKVSKLIFHLGAGVASLLTAEEPSDDNRAILPYKSIGDAIYIDLNIKFAK